MDMYTVKFFFEVIIVLWIGYNGWRVYSAPVNAVEVGAEVRTDCPLKFTFQTYMRVRDFYLRLSPGHKKYEMTGTDLTKDVVINIWETAGFQFVKHQYRVIESVPNKRMKLVSEKSQVTVMGLVKGETRSEVEFRFDAAGDEQTNLGLTIRIIFPNWFRHLLARVFFTEVIWHSHACGEMDALAKIIEEYYAAKAVA